MPSSLPPPEYPYRLSESPFSVHTYALQQVPEGSAVLEVGCSRGYLSERLKERGCRVVGIEVDPAAAEQARAHCAEVLNADVDALDASPWPPESFDVLMFLDVLEHLKEPERALRLLSPCLRPSGRLIVSLPNVANWHIRYSLLRGRFEYEPAGIMDRTHLRFFTRASAEALIVDAGYEIVHRDFTPGITSISSGCPEGDEPSSSAAPSGDPSLRTRTKRRLLRLFPGLLAQQFFFVARPGARAD